MEQVVLPSTLTPIDLLKQQALPEHIAIIMDGNGRWAKCRGQHRVAGHNEGVESVRDITEACAELGVKYLTLYTFSTENWRRPESEVNALMHLLIYSIQNETETLKRNRVRLNAIGDLTRLPDEARAVLLQAIEDTAGGDRLMLNLALSYSGRWDIIHATRALAERVRKGEIDADDIDERVFSQALDTHGIPDPDLVIRTGGEYRVSNFLLWQMAYSELFITDRFWPDFRRQNLYEAILQFQERDRRFGGLSEAEDPVAVPGTACNS